MNLRPLQDRIIVKRVEEETKTAGGLFIPETAKEKPQRGQVIAVGDGKVNVRSLARYIENTAGNGKKTEDGKVLPLDVKVGDIVLFGKYAGTEVKVDGNDYLMMREDDILAVVE